MHLTSKVKTEQLTNSLFMLVAVEKKDRYLVAKVCKNTNHDSVITFLREAIVLYSIQKSIESDNSS